MEHQIEALTGKVSVKVRVRFFRYRDRGSTIGLCQAQEWPVGNADRQKPLPRTKRRARRPVQDVSRRIVIGRSTYTRNLQNGGARRLSHCGKDGACLSSRYRPHVQADLERVNDSALFRGRWGRLRLYSHGSRSLPGAQERQVMSECSGAILLLSLQLPGWIIPFTVR